MTDQPAPTFEQLLDEWVELSATVKRMVERERALRELLVTGAFPTPKVGVNTRELADGRILKATVKVNVNVDQEIAAKAEEELRRRNNPGVFKVKYELAKKPYDALTDEMRQIADAALTRKLGAPTLEVI